MWIFVDENAKKRNESKNAERNSVSIDAQYQ
jgi:hypothetical protein